MSAPPAFEFVEGATSDLSFVARGGSPEAVFAAAAEALLAATLENPESVGRRVERRLELEEPDLELLLLAFLNELVYLRDAEQLLLRAEELRIAAGRPARLHAQLRGELLRADRHQRALDVKAATAHGLRVARAGDGWEATVTLDV